MKTYKGDLKSAYNEIVYKYLDSLNRILDTYEKYGEKRYDILQPDKAVKDLINLEYTKMKEDLFMHLQLRRLKLGAFIEKFAHSENALDETFDYIYYLIAAEENMYKVLTEFKMRNPYALKFAGVYTSKSDRKGRDIKLGDKQAEINDFLGKYMRLTREYASDVFRFKSEKHQEKVKEITNNIEELIDLYRNYLEMHPDPGPEDFEP